MNHYAVNGIVWKSTHLHVDFAQISIKVLLFQLYWLSLKFKTINNKYGIANILNYTSIWEYALYNCTYLMIL